ncbi:hypothetical protein M409DRAFT_67924 [Zasmidium cellare ATCC 36951]|uniref:Glutathione S-transferase n=1 Tax=Zasmidium cellare ATCC 36951 TaxID=1080233 RepID=A0A6A6CG83_ZASCE|nr:uncharacterized protein M409DRAFT_67924 [Zasmidium cellare ATCC 36951]KAF2164426.1 hypothetical protein M409DRAFT_67924 [Zasmidium cellare ATCC 36951]
MSSNIHLYTTNTPNGVKISVTLEELGLPYEVTKIDFAKNTQKEPWFLEINPNGRIPALTDTFADGEQIRVFESGSIMEYLVSRYDKDYKISFAPGTREHIEMTSWLFFLNAGVGPIQIETKRLYGVLDKHLGENNREYLIGNKCTIADIAHIGWIASSGWAGIDIDQFPDLKAWKDRMWARPVVQKGMNVPERDAPRRGILKGEVEESIAAEARAWILKGMKEDAGNFK